MGGRPKREEMLRRMLLAMLFFRFGNLTESEGLGESDGVIMLLAAVLAVSADWRVSMGIDKSSARLWLSLVASGW